MSIFRRKKKFNFFVDELTSFSYHIGMGSKETETTIYEIKKGRKRSMVRATSMQALADWAKNNGVKSWSTGWMYSAQQMTEYKNLPVVA